MTDEQELFTAATFREHQNEFGDRDPEVHSHAAVVRDPAVSWFLSAVEEEYDPSEAEEPGEMPGTADGLREVRKIRRMGATENARQAMENGDFASLKHLTGDQNQRADVSGMKAIQMIDQIIESPAPVIVILGEMGAGKTDLAGLIGQRARHLLGIEKVASNIRSLKETDPWVANPTCSVVEERGEPVVVDQDGQRVPDVEPRDGYVPNFSTLDEWVKQDGNPLDYEQAPKLFIGDEFSSAASGSGKQGYLTRRKMGPLVFKIRKYGGILVYIGHDESSIHPLLWRLGVVIKKTSKKTAIVADKIKNGELRDELFDIEGIPPTDWRYRTKEASSWSWTDADDDEPPEPGEVAYDVAVWTTRECKRDGLSHRETARYIPFGKSWVGDRWDEILDGEHDAALDRVAAITA